MKEAWERYQKTNSPNLFQVLGCNEHTSPLEIHLCYKQWLDEISTNKIVPVLRARICKEYDQFNLQQPLLHAILSTKEDSPSAEVMAACKTWKALNPLDPTKLPGIEGALKTFYLMPKSLAALETEIQRAAFMFSPKPAKAPGFFDKNLENTMNSTIKPTGPKG